MSGRRHPPMFRRTVTVLLGTAVLLPSLAHADVARLRNGRALQVSGFRLDGDRVVLLMSGGGEVALPHDQVLEIRRDPVLPGPDAPPFTPPPSIVAPAAAAPPMPGAPADGGVVARPDGDAAVMALPIGGVFDRLVLEDLAARMALRHGVDESLVRAVIQVESRFDAFAVSPRGAMGLMQLMPPTALRFDVRNAFDPIENVDAGVRYLKELLARYGGETRLALAAYNAGEEAVERHGGVPPYRETMHYVRRVLSEIRR